MFGCRGRTGDRCRAGDFAIYLPAIFCLSAVIAAASDPADVKIHRSKTTGLATLITAGGKPIPTNGPAAQGKPTPNDFFREYGHLFGILDADSELRPVGTEFDSQLNRSRTTFEQHHRGVRVFSGVLRTHQNAAGDILAASGRFRPIPAVFTITPRVTLEDAVAAAKSEFATPNSAARVMELVIVDPGWYGDPPRGARLAYYIELSEAAAGLADAYFIDAGSGEMLDRWSMNHESLVRRIFNGNGGATIGSLARSEGDSPVPSPADVNRTYDYAEDFFGYFSRAFARDSLDDAGISLTATVNSTAPSSCPNAFWSGSLHQIFLCNGLAVDDVIAHEFMHGVTQFTAGLIYQNQSGQINESYSDIFGELVDLYNGNTSAVVADGGEFWPTVHPTGSGLDLPNEARTSDCLNGVAVRINSPADIAAVLIASRARIGTALTPTGVTGNVVLANPPTACPAGSPLQNAAEVNGNIVLIDAGSNCSAIARLTNAQNAGAIGAIIMSTTPPFPPNIAGTDPRVTISSAGLSFDDGSVIRNRLPIESVNVTLYANTPGVSQRWLVGEEATVTSGAVRDMWNPPCYFNPDFADSPLNTCGESDDGGVHSGSGVLNHAFAMAVDGKSFRGFDIHGIGPIKAGAVWYRAVATYLTPASDFEDAFLALNESAFDLIGTFPNDPRTGLPSSSMFTADDAAQIDLALQAVQLNSPGRCGSGDDVLRIEAAPRCAGAALLFTNDFEQDAPGWSVTTAGPNGPPTLYDWELTSSPLPFGRPGTAWFCRDADVGNCTTEDETAVHSLITPPIKLPKALVSPRLAFTHYMESEGGWDGGNVQISVNEGPWQSLPRTACRFNPQNGRFFSNQNGKTHPLARQDAWTGAGGRWGTSILRFGDFVLGGESVQFRFNFAKDKCGGITGWFVDDVSVYDCPDCDANFSADEDEVHYVSASPVLSNIGMGAPQTHLLMAPPPAQDDVTLHFTVSGDFRGLTEFLTIDINGTVVGTVFSQNATDCNNTPDYEELIVPAATFNAAVASGDALITMTATDAVDPSLSECQDQSYVTLVVEYDIVGPDKDGSGVPDVCEPDFDGDGDLDVRDIALYLRCFTGVIKETGESCDPADRDGDHHVTIEDLQKLVPYLYGPR